MPLLEINGLRAGYGKIAVVRDISLFVERGEIVAIIGANGAGKSTLLRAVSGIVPVTSGAISFNGRDLTAMPPHAIAKGALAHVPEGRGVFGNLTVVENLTLAFFAKPRENRAARQAALEAVFDKFPVLKDRAAQKAATLSGGEQQMLAVGRAMVADAELFMFDEPSLGLSPIYATQVFSIISDLQKQGKSVLLVEQNATMALRIARRAYVLENGRVVAEGASDAIANDPRLKEAYLG